MSGTAAPKGRSTPPGAIRRQVPPWRPASRAVSQPTGYRAMGLLLARNDLTLGAAAFRSGVVFREQPIPADLRCYLVYSLPDRQQIWPRARHGHLSIPDGPSDKPTPPSSGDGVNTGGLPSPRDAELHEASTSRKPGLARSGALMSRPQGPVRLSGLHRPRQANALLLQDRTTCRPCSLPRQRPDHRISRQRGYRPVMAAG